MRIVYPADPFELIPTVTPRPVGRAKHPVVSSERKPPPWVRVLDRPRRTVCVVLTYAVMFVSAGSAAGAGLPGTAGSEGALPAAAWIAPELAAPEREEPAGTAVGGWERASVGASTPSDAPTLPRSHAPTPSSLRDRLAQRSYKNEAPPGPTSASARPAGHTAAFVEAIRRIEAMERAKAGRPSRPIGGYQDAGARLEDPSELPGKGYGWAFSSWVLNRKTNFGTDPMVFGLMEVFAVMADLHPDGVEVRMEDIGKAGGGPLDPHISHRTGRDADLSLFGRDDKGKAVTPRVRYDGKGSGGNGLRFDTARNWDFACAMFECTRFEVHSLLIDQPLKDLLLSHGRERAAKARTDAERERQERLVGRGERLLRDGGPGHANHYHLRIK